MASTLLKRLGYAVLSAANGGEALILKGPSGTGEVDIVFTDLVMPEMGGVELSERVRAIYPRVRILFTSAYTEHAVAHQNGSDHRVAFLQKPFTPSALARKLRQVLDQPASSVGLVPLGTASAES